MIIHHRFVIEAIKSTPKIINKIIFSLNLIYNFLVNYVKVSVIEVCGMNYR